MAFKDIGNVITFTPVTGDFADPPNPDGAHTFQVRAIGSGDRGDAIGSKDFVIDTTPPAAPALVSPASGDLISTLTVNFEWALSTSDDIFSYRLQVTSGDINTGPFDADKELFHPNTGDVVTLSGDDVYRWRVGAKDEVGNEIPTGDLEVRVFTIVTAVPPSAPTLVTPASGDRINDNTPFFEWTPSSGDIVDYRLLVSSGDIEVGPFDIEEVVAHPGTGHQAILPLGDGTYEWRVIARDAGALNTASSITQAFTVDTTPPAPAPTLVTPGSGDRTNDNTPFFEWTPSSGDIVDYLLQVSSGDIEVGPFDIEEVVAHPGTGHQAILPLGDGTYEWRVIARDAGALNTASSITQAFTVDTTPPAPAPTLVTPASGDRTNDNTPFFEWTPSSGDVVDYLLQVSSGDIGLGPFDIEEVVAHPGTGHQAILPLGDGTYEWRVIARDADALNTASSITQPFTLDTTPPTKPGDLREETTGDELVRVFTWIRSVDPAPLPPGSGDGSGVDFYEIVITGPQTVITTADDNDIICPDRCQFTTPVLTPGSYSIEVSAVDRATNEGGAATADFRAGSLGVVQGLQVVDPVFENTVNVSAPAFQWSPPLQLPDSGDVQGGIETYEVAISGDLVLTPAFNIQFRSFTDTNFFVVECFDKDGNPIGTGDACKGAIGTGDRIQIRVEGPGVPNGVPDGTHLLRVRVLPKVGDIGTPVGLTFTVDTTPPAPAPTLVTPGSGDRTNDNAPFFEWTPSSGDIVEYRLQVTSGDIEVGPFDIEEVVAHPGTGHQAILPLGDGTYEWRVIASDLALNTASSITQAFTVDTVAPAPAPTLVTPASGDRINDNTPFFEWTPSSGDIVEYRLLVSSGDIELGPFDIEEVVAHPGTGHQAILPLGDGTYEWRVIARDAGALNTVSSITQTFTVDTTPPAPAPTLVTPASGDRTNDNTPFFEWTPSSRDIVDYLLQVSSGDIGLGPFDIEEVVAHPGTGHQAILPLGDGTYEWRVIARDADALNTASSITQAFTMDAVAPAAPALVRPQTGDIFNRRRVEFEWEPSTSDDISTYRLQVTSGDIDTGPFDVDKELVHPITGDVITLSGDGAYRWRVRARDEAGNEVRRGSWRSGLSVWTL